VYLRALAYLANARSNIEANRPIEVQPAAAVIKDMISLQYDMDAEFYQITVEFGNETDYVYSHSVNTAIYCLKVGQRLGYPPKALLELGLAALLCDVGMFRIPEEIVNKKGKLSASEIDAVKSHPKLGEEVLLPFKKDFPAAGEAVLQHQERENGQGYPRGLKGDEISEYAKIIGICDSYEAMTHNRPHKKALMQTESIRELIGSKNQLFSPKVIKAFLDEISIFPIGSYVRLNNRNIGCVIATNRMNPLKPTIRLLFDENGRRFIDPKVIDLKAHPILNIEGSVSRDELPA
jgi:HD-GYP domain-containing protein (c-di-GMP phosphodiesterase class II)